MFYLMVKCRLLILMCAYVFVYFVQSGSVFHGGLSYHQKEKKQDI